MIVIGADTHKRSHTLAAVDEATGRALGDVTVPAAPRSFGELLRWARAVGGERVWALEDCRHVSGSLGPFLRKRGERVVRVPPKLMAGARESTREPGKSDRRRRSGSRRDPGRPRQLAGRAAGRRRARHPVARRSPRQARQTAHSIDQRSALAAARPLARARDPAARTDRQALAATPRAAPGTRRAVRSRPRRA